MASIPGSQFYVFPPPPGMPVNVVETSNGDVPPAQPGSFNFEVYTGPLPGPTVPASGYQGLADLTDNGDQLNLISGQFTIMGLGAQNVINGGPGDDTIYFFNSDDTIGPGTGNENILVTGNGEVVAGGSGNDTILVFGQGDSVTATGTGADSITVGGDNNTVTGNNGPDTITVYGLDDSVNAGSGGNTINVYGVFDTVNAGSGADTIAIYGVDDTVTSGTSGSGGTASISLFGADHTFVDGNGTYSDTITGFDHTFLGDTIQLNAADGGASNIAAIVSSQQSENGGQDTLITLHDGSTILLKGVGSVNSSFFS